MLNTISSTSKVSCTNSRIKTGAQVCVTNEYTNDTAIIPPAKEGPVHSGSMSVLFSISYDDIAATVMARPLNAYDMFLKRFF